MKKIVVVVIVFTIMLAITGLTSKVFATEESDLEYRTISYIEHFFGPSYGFTYSNEMFLKNSEELSTDMAKMSVTLSACAYNTENIEYVLDNMGFEIKNQTYYNYDRIATLEDNDFVAFCIASKIISYNGKDYKVYVVPVRGTPETAEWFSDFKLSENNDSNKNNGNHYGFHTAANEVISEILYKISTDEVDEEHTVVLVTGHSRGAAVANIVAGHLCSSKYSKYIKKEHIFGYTYACPSVSKYADNTLTNIYNFNNPGDAVPILPLQGEGWNYKRYGQTVELDITHFGNVSKRFEEVKGEKFLSRDNSDFYKKILSDLIVNESDFYSADNKVLLTFLPYMLGGKNSTSLEELLNYYFKEEGGEALLELASFCNDKGPIASTINTIQEYLNGNKNILRNAINETSSYTEEEFKQWLYENYDKINKLESSFKVNIDSRADLIRSELIFNKQQAFALQCIYILTDIKQSGIENLSKIIDIINHRSYKRNLSFLDKFNVFWVRRLDW